MPDPLTLGLGLGLGIGLPAIAACVTGICYRYHWRQEAGETEDLMQRIQVVVTSQKTEDKSYTSPACSDGSPSSDPNAFIRLPESPLCEKDHSDKSAHLPKVQQNAITAETVTTSITFNNHNTMQKWSSTQSEQRSSEQTALELVGLAKEGLGLTSSMTSGTASSAIKGAKTVGEAVSKKFNSNSSKSRKSNEASDAEGSVDELKSTSSSLSHNHDRYIKKHASRGYSHEEHDSQAFRLRNNSSDESTPELPIQSLRFTDNSSSPQFMIIPVPYSAHGSRTHSRGPSPLFEHRQNEVFTSSSALSKQTELQRLASLSVHGTPEDELRSVVSRGLNQNKRNETVSPATAGKNEDDSPGIKKVRLDITRTELEIKAIQLQGERIDAQILLGEKLQKLQNSESGNVKNTPSASPVAYKAINSEVCQSKATSNSDSSSASAAITLPELTKHTSTINEDASAAVETIQESLPGLCQEQEGRFVRVLSASQLAPSPPPSPAVDTLTTPKSNNSYRDSSEHSSHSNLIQDFSSFQPPEQDILSPTTKSRLKSSVQNCFGFSSQSSKLSEPQMHNPLSHHSDAPWGAKVIGDCGYQTDNSAHTPGD